VRLETPRLVVAGLSGDSGKTLVTLGLARALTRRRLAVHTYKKGPDYIDAAWLAAASGQPCRNLDTFMMGEEALGAALLSAGNADVLLIEGNRGLLDGVDAAGSHSTAGLAKRLAAPVVLVVEVSKVTRTVGALVLGCTSTDPGVRIAGVVLNKVATDRQERLIREAVEEIAGTPVLGAVPRLSGHNPLPSRHLGLLTAAEHPDREAAIEVAAKAVAAAVDLDRLLEVSRSAPPIDLAMPPVGPRAGAQVRVGYFHDQAFSFYYPENLEQLRAGGAELIETSPLREQRLPEIDALYLGGGFPEAHTPALAANTAYAASLRDRVAAGLPVYAECGGLMYLARELLVGGVTYPMAGVFDIVVEQTARPQGHGYEIAVVDRPNPFFPVGAELVGHEFHYSRAVSRVGPDRTVLAVHRGQGIGGGRDGIVADHAWGSYLHVHALGTPAWAPGLLALARRFAAERTVVRARWA
jgi:cobyrinic acid a,c-diamide synthase